MHTHTPGPVVTTVCNIKSLPRGWQTVEAYQNHVYIGRSMSGLLPPFTFGNPFKVGDKLPEYGVTKATLDDCLRLYEGHLNEQLRDIAFRLQVQALHGKTLVCWCAAYGNSPGSTCHGDILARYADQLEDDAIAVRHQLLRLRSWESEKATILLSDQETEATLKHHLASLRLLRPPMETPQQVREAINPVFQADLRRRPNQYTFAQRQRLR